MLTSFHSSNICCVLCARPCSGFLGHSSEQNTDPYSHGTNITSRRRQKINLTSKYIVCHTNAMENTQGDEEEKGVPVGGKFTVLCIG